MPPIVIKHGRTLTVVFSLLHYTFGDAGEVDREGGDLLQRRGRGDNIIESLSSALSTRSLLLHTFSAKQDKTQIFPRSRSRDYRSSLSCRSLFLIKATIRPNKHVNTLEKPTPLCFPGVAFVLCSGPARVRRCVMFRSVCFVIKSTTIIQKQPCEYLYRVSTVRYSRTTVRQSTPRGTYSTYVRQFYAILRTVPSNN
mgnify:CR=1 FL=1